MPTISEPRELFLTELKSLLYVEQEQADQVLPQLKKEVQNPELEQGFDRHLEETRRHVANIEQVFGLMGEEAKADKSHAIDGLKAQHDKVFKNIESPELRDVFNAGAAAKTEHLEISAYESMITMAKSLREAQIADLLSQNLDDEKKTLAELERVSEQLTTQAAAV